MLRHLPNALTTIRLLLIFPFVYFVVQGQPVYAGLTALIAILSDMDGTVARKIGATSSFGALYDPIVDATFMVVAFAALVYSGKVWWWPVAIFFAAVIFKTLPQTLYLRKHGKVKSVFASKTMGLIGFGSVIVGAFGFPAIISALALLVGALGYAILGILWLRDS